MNKNCKILLSFFRTPVEAHSMFFFDEFDKNDVYTSINVPENIMNVIENVKLVYNYLVANHLILTEILKDYILHVDEDADEIAYMISKKNGEVHIDHNFKDKLLNLIKDEGWRDDLVEMASYLYLDKHLPKEIKFNSDQRLRGGHISIYRH
jgi:hypothetical protein